MEKCNKHEALVKAVSLVTTTPHPSPAAPAPAARGFTEADELEKAALMGKVFSYFKKALPLTKKATGYLQGRSIDYTQPCSMKKREKPIHLKIPLSDSFTELFKIHPHAAPFNTGSRMILPISFSTSSIISRFTLMKLSSISASLTSRTSGTGKAVSFCSFLTILAWKVFKASLYQDHPPGYPQTPRKTKKPAWLAT